MAKHPSWRKKLYDRPNTCGGKNCYASRAEAEMVARTQELLNANDRLSLHVYRCNDCRSWHLTRHKPQTT